MSGTGERVVVEHYRSAPEQYLIYLFHMASYRFAERYTKGCEVLDYGCGSGYGSAVVAAEAARVVGVDVSDEAIEHARANFSAPRLEFAPIEADRPLSFPDHSFDTVLSFQVIEHVRDPAAYLSEVRRVLRPGGHLVLTTPERRTRLLPAQRPWNRWHLTEYSERTLGRALTPHFSQVELLGMTGSKDVLEIELRRTRRAKWLMLPATLPLLPDRWRIRLLEHVHRLREARADESPQEPRDYDFDESALRIGPDVWPSVNIVAVARP
jgi:SAM-dependent methyltransferase